MPPSRTFCLGSYRGLHKGLGLRVWGAILGTAPTQQQYIIGLLLIKGLIYPCYEYYSTATQWGQYPRFSVEGLGLKVEGLGLRFRVLGLRVWGLGWVMPP